MEELHNKLKKLFTAELARLNSGYSYNTDAIKQMRQICKLLYYYKYIDVTSNDIINRMKIYD